MVCGLHHSAAKEIETVFQRATTKPQQTIFFTFFLSFNRGKIRTGDMAYSEPFIITFAGSRHVNSCAQRIHKRAISSLEEDFRTLPPPGLLTILSSSYLHLFVYLFPA